MKAKTLQEELDYWGSLSQEKKDKIWNKKIEKIKQKRVKSTLKKMDKYLKSGARTY